MHYAPLCLQSQGNVIKICAVNFWENLDELPMPQDGYNSDNFYYWQMF